MMSAARGGKNVTDAIEVSHVFELTTIADTKHATAANFIAAIMAVSFF
jgi:hypothetical protein